MGSEASRGDEPITRVVARLVGDRRPSCIWDRVLGKAWDRRWVGKRRESEHGHTKRL